MVFHAAHGKGQQIMIFADGCRVRPQARQKVAGKYLLSVLGAEDKVDMVLCVAVGHVFSVGAVILHRHRRVSPPTGLAFVIATLPGASAPGLGSFAPSGAGACEGARRKCAHKYRT